MFDGVLMIGGSASVGKTTLAAALAERLGVGVVVHLDDVRGEHTGVIHHLDRDVVWDAEPKVLLRLLLEETSSLHPILLDLVGRLLERGGAAIVEGEGIEPDAIETFTDDPRVRAAYVIETNREELRRTFSTRASAAGFVALTRRQQDSVVEMNCRYGLWLQDQVGRRRGACLPSQPWATLEERVVRATGLQ